MQPVGDGQHVSLDERCPIGQSGCLGGGGRLGNGNIGEVDPGHTARAGAHPGQRVHAGVALQVDEVTAGHVAGDVEVEPVQSGPAGEKAARVVDIVLTVHGRTLVPPAPIDVHTATVPHRDPSERTNMRRLQCLGRSRGVRPITPLIDDFRLTPKVLSPGGGTRY